MWCPVTQYLLIVGVIKQAGLRIKIPCFYHMKVTPSFHDMRRHEGIPHVEIRILRIFKTTPKNDVSKDVTYVLLTMTLSHIDVF